MNDDAFGSGSIHVFGGLGNDILTVTSRDSATLQGEDGADTLTATATTFNVSGGELDDTITVTLTASGGNEALATGGTGDDSLTGTGHGLTLQGDAGQDVLLLSGSGSLSGGSEDDMLTYTGAFSAFQVNTTVDGGSDDDSLTVTGRRITALGGIGNDTLSASFEWVGAGTEVIDGGSGDDTLHVTAIATDSAVGTASFIVAGGSGNDTITSFNGSESPIDVSERFTFDGSWRDDVITGFTDIKDFIVFDVTGGSGPSTFQDLTISDVLGHTLIEFGSFSIYLLGIDPLGISQADFVFL